MRNTTLAFLLGAGIFVHSSAFAESSIQYHRGSVKIDYESYNGLRRDFSMPVHELSLLDSSGALSASLSNMGSEYAAREGAIAEEKRKVREGESLGGPKMITYNWTEVAAQDGDVKRYGLRLASTENILSLEPITGMSKTKYSSMAEIYMIGTMTNDVILARDSFLLMSNIFFGARWGSFRDTDKTATGPALEADSGYFYLPLTYRLGLYFPIGLRLYLEAGLDPVTLVRHQFSKADQKIPNDIVVTPALEFRFHPNVGLGVRSEDYRGSLIQSDRWLIKNPQFRQRMTTAFINFSG